MRMDKSRPPREDVLDIKWTIHHCKWTLLPWAIVISIAEVDNSECCTALRVRAGRALGKNRWRNIMPSQRLHSGILKDCSSIIFLDPLSIDLIFLNWNSFRGYWSGSRFRTRPALFHLPLSISPLFFRIFRILIIFLDPLSIDLSFLDWNSFRYLDQDRDFGPGCRFFISLSQYPLYSWESFGFLFFLDPRSTVRIDPSLPVLWLLPLFTPCFHGQVSELQQLRCGGYQRERDTNRKKRGKFVEPKESKGRDRPCMQTRDIGGSVGEKV
jgi:hypothetical protein